MTVAYTLTNNSITLFLDGRPQTVDSSSPTFDQLKEALRQNADEDTLRNLISTRRYVETNTYGRVTVSGDTVFYDDQEMHGHLVDRMLAMLRDGFDIAPLARFMARLMHNPSTRAIDELFLWLEGSKMPITADGHFLAYKKVRDDYHDFFSGKMNNAIGSVIEMDRTEVDPDRFRTCSAGLHFCSFAYLPHYYGDRGRVLVVKIDPADVVAIPDDYSNAKGRAWRYAVVGEVPQEDAEFAFRTPVVDSFGTYDDSYDDDAEIDDYFEDDDPWGFPPDYYDEDPDFDDDEENLAELDELDRYLDEVDEDDEDDGDEEVDDDGTVITFYHKPTGFRATGLELVNLLLTHGQRGASRMTGVPRTTLQEWLNQLHRPVTT
jgi:hypothetical protein